MILTRFSDLTNLLSQSLLNHMSIQVNLHDKPAIQSAIAQVRLDSSKINYAVVTHLNDDPNTLVLHKTGTDGYDGLIASLDSTKAQYALRIDL